VSNVREAEKRYNDLIQKSLEHFAGPLFKEEIFTAKTEFFENSGVLDENAPQYELRMSQFFDWYFFSRDLRGYGQTPLESLFMTRELRFSPGEVELIDKLKQHRHSLFEFIKMKGQDVFIRDLLKGDKITVRECPYTTGFNSDEIFEARLLPFEDTWIFTKGFCFHPVDARKFILSEVKRHRKDSDLNPEDLMLTLIKMRYRSERYRHVRVDLIYSHESKMG
jgi:hypothetical protein